MRALNAVPRCLLVLLSFLYPALPAAGQPAQEVLLEESFESAPTTPWTLFGPPPNDVRIAGSGYRGGNLLLLDLVDASNAQYVLAEAALPAPAGEVLARVFFYDDATQPLATQLMVLDPSGQQQTGLGTLASSPQGNYVLRLDSFANTVDTGVARTTGWHMFEIVVTPAGAFAKIDNKLVSDATGAPRKNSDHTSLDRFRMVSTWGTAGQARYDEARVVRADARPWQEQLLEPLRVHYELYSSDGAFPFAGLYPTLGSGTSSNDLRAVMDSVIAWYVYGEQSGDPVAQLRARQAFDEAWEAAPWQRNQDVDDWARGLAMSRVAMAAYLLRAEPEVLSRLTEIKQVIHDQALLYKTTNRMPQSGYVGDTKAEENAWHAAFLAAAVNLFPDATGSDRDWLEARARCFAYHALTYPGDPAGCGIQTQTIQPDWTLENGNQRSPTYMAATLQILADGAFTYLAAGHSIPAEFTHNVQPLFAKYLTFIDTDTYHFKDAPPQWSGVAATAYLSPGLFRYAEILGLPDIPAWSDFLAKRSLFFHDMASEWISKLPEEIDISSWFSYSQPGYPSTDSYKFLLDSAIAGEYAGLAVVSQSWSSGCPAGGQVISLRSRNNGLLVAAHNLPAQPNDWVLQAEGVTIGDEDKYEVIGNVDGTLSLRSVLNGKLVAAYDRAGQPDAWLLRAEGLGIGPEDKFLCNSLADGSITLRSSINNQLVSAGPWNDWRLRVEGSFVGPEDTFEFYVHP